MQEYGFTHLEISFQIRPNQSARRVAGSSSVKGQHLGGVRFRLGVNHLVSLIRDQLEVELELELEPEPEVLSVLAEPQFWLTFS